LRQKKFRSAEGEPQIFNLQTSIPACPDWGEVVGKIIRMVEHAISIPGIRYLIGQMNINCDSILFKKV